MFDMINNPKYDTFKEKGFGMLSQEFLSPKSIVEAKIQSRVAEFLGLKEKLLRLSASTNLSLAKKASNLLITQKVVESDLTSLQPTIDKIKQGLYSFTDLAKLTKLGVEIEAQIEASKNLIRSAGGLPELPELFSWKTLLIGGIGITSLIYFLKRKKMI